MLTRSALRGERNIARTVSRSKRHASRCAAVTPTRGRRGTCFCDLQCHFSLLGHGRCGDRLASGVTSAARASVEVNGLALQRLKQSRSLFCRKMPGMNGPRRGQLPDPRAELSTACTLCCASWVIHFCVTEAFAVFVGSIVR